MRLITRSRLHDFSLVLAVLLAASATSWSLALGLAVWTVGVVLQVWSKAALKRYDELSTTGPYALCRHPFYLANAIFDLGLCVMSGNSFLVALYPLAFWAGYGPTMRKEEAELTRAFPEAYAEFRRTTSMVLPTFRRLWRDRRAPLSWENLRVERQLSRTVRYGAFPLMVWLAARVWANPVDVLTPANLAIVAGAAALGLLGLVLYAGYEGRTDSTSARAAVWLAPHAALITAAAFFAVAALREIDAGRLAFAATLSALLIGWSQAAGALGALVHMPAWVRRGLTLAVLAALAVYGAWALQAVWVMPFVLSAVAAAALAPEPRLRAPKLHLAAGIVLVAAGLGALGVFLSTWDPTRISDALRAAPR